MSAVTTPAGEKKNAPSLFSSLTLLFLHVALEMYTRTARMVDGEYKQLVGADDVEGI